MVILHFFVLFSYPHNVLATSENITPIYRFWSDTYGGHFFTLNPLERDNIIYTMPEWSYEGSVWSALIAADQEALPVYRFWSDQLRAHFFTINESEKNYIIGNLPVWTYEGIAWYAYSTDGDSRQPIFRFWSPVYQGHFYTADSHERDAVLTYPEWNYEGVAWYAPVSNSLSNQAPAASNISRSINVYTPYVEQQTSAIDADGDTLTYELISPASGTGYTDAYINPYSGILYVTITEVATGTLNLYYRATDGLQFSNYAKVSLNFNYTDGLNTGDQPVAITVTNSSDAVNGDVSSPVALLSDSGIDGISLREAILACNTAHGLKEITFSQALVGQVISLTEPLPVITTDYLTIVGTLDANGEPAVTIDAGGLKVGGLKIFSSDVAVMRLRFIGLTDGGWPGIQISEQFPSDGQVVPKILRNIRIEGNVFEGVGESSNRNAIVVTPQNSGATISDVFILRNKIINFKGEGDGVMLGMHTTNSAIDNVLIQENLFSGTTYPIELVSINANNRLSNTKIINNTFVDNGQPITLTTIANGDMPASGNIIKDTLISHNVFINNENPVAIDGGLNPGAKDNVVQNTEIINNLITGTRPFAVVAIVGGRNGASRNQIDGVLIINNTIAMNPIIDSGASALAVVSNIDASANTITRVKVMNTIFWGNQCNDFSGLSLDQVQFSITSQSGFAGVNGNISANPQFVSPSVNNFHLQPGSPAIDAGSWQAATRTDLEFRERVGNPDIGAFEFSSSPNTGAR